MSYSITDLVEEIKDLIEYKISNSIPIKKDWVVKEIMEMHNSIAGDDTDFFRCAAKLTVSEQVRRQIGKFKVTPETQELRDAQIVLPGFERLQRAYLLDIDGEQVAVPLKKMSVSQCMQKAAELRRMGAGCYQHANELDRYVMDHAA